MKTNIFKILIAGEGGQGIQALSKILSLALLNSGYEVSYIPQFGPEQRGTPSIAYVQCSKDKITYPKFLKADLLVILRKRAFKRISSYIGADTMIIFDSSTIPRNLFSQNNSRVFAMPATKIAEENFKPKVINILILAVLSEKILDLDKKIVWNCIEKELKKKFIKSPELIKLNQDALEFGYRYIFENKKYSTASFDTNDKIIIKKGLGKTAILVPRFCKGCGICIYKCPAKALKFGKILGVYGTATPDIDLEKCIVCGNCYRFCPDCAIKVKKE